jgi:hypothetical protein
MTPSKVEFDLGLNCHRQLVKLVYEKMTSGGYAWTLLRDQADQRDDTSAIHGLTDAQLVAMAEAVKAVKR